MLLINRISQHCVLVHVTLIASYNIYKRYMQHCLLMISMCFQLKKLKWPNVILKVYVKH